MTLAAITATTSGAFIPFPVESVRVAAVPLPSDPPANAYLIPPWLASLFFSYVQ